jgi:thiol-disulfide isomerase/thioredoxin
MLLVALSSVPNRLTIFQTHSFRSVTLGLLGGLLVVAIAFAAPVRPQSADAAKRSSTVSVQTIKLDGLKTLFKRDPANARPLLVNFWATWCDPCREEFPDLVKIDKQYRGKNLDLIAISLDDVADLKKGVTDFLNESNATMPVYLLDETDPSPAIEFVDPKWSGALPATILYDRKGEIIYKHFGRFNESELRIAIEKALK